ncbi:hypothetical protein GGF44_003286 [Coemansia sp. RSA 1694]|nr:hypothetical protein GGF44_003286 [Coemansia sp. RSA 1694]
MERPRIQPRRSCPQMSRPEPSNPFYSSTSSSSNLSFVWAPPTPDPEYWDNVARAREIRRSVAEMKAQLAQARREADIQRLSAEIRASERRLMKHVDRHILSYDDVVEPAALASPDIGLSSPGIGFASPGIGLASPGFTPTSPSTAPDRPLPPTPTPHFASGALPPTPPLATAIAALGSQAFINSYKQSPGCQLPACDEAPEPSAAASRKPAWASLFGSRSVRLAGAAPPADRLGLPSPVSPRRLHAA